LGLLKLKAASAFTGQDQQLLPDGEGGLKHRTIAECPELEWVLPYSWGEKKAKLSVPINN
jgi:hypothetical protein